MRSRQKDHAVGAFPDFACHSVPGVEIRRGAMVWRRHSRPSMVTSLLAGAVHVSLRLEAAITLHTSLFVGLGCAGQMHCAIRSGKE